MKQDVVLNSLKLAQELQNKVNSSISQKEKSFHEKMKKLLVNPKNKVMLIELLDRSFRSKDPSKCFDLIKKTFDKYGVADFFSPYEKFLLFSFLNFGKLLPGISVPFFIDHIRQDTKDMVLDANISVLKPHIQNRRRENITLNVNFIGEEVLGESEAAFRIKKYEEAIKSDFISYISIKITTIFSQINIIDFDYSKKEIVKRLSHLYELAISEQKRQNMSKFINLDMEEYRDLELTSEAFKEAISKYPDYQAGIVLQAYIPDSFKYLQDLFEFSKQRVENGGKPIKIRFVKGANMEAEETVASQKGWALPAFDKKVDTDSNYKKMLYFILENERYKYINIGIASHNIFEIAHAYTLISQSNALDSFTFEMLEGMSLQTSFELSKLHELILYAPVCDKEHFNNAIAYLVRRLDENTAKDNFMRYFFDLKVGDENWEIQKEIFLNSLKGIEALDNTPRRKQNRLEPVIKSEISKTDIFVNESDTDFVLQNNRKLANLIKEKYTNLDAVEISAMGNKALHSDEILEVRNKINDKLIAKIGLASKQGISEALDMAKNSKYSELSFEEIYQILSKAAEIFRAKRGELLGIAALEVGKTFGEIDPEISEAIDFIEFYPHSLRVLQKQNPKTKFKPKGISVTISPWNFPIGIPVGTIVGPLAAGNRVIFKPSSLSSVTGYEICKMFWEAGIPKDALIYLPTKGKMVSECLLKDDLVKFCVLTGGEDTAYNILKENPKIVLSAETGGKNATIVTKAADRDSAIKNIIHSAFSNSGQKCSATSLLILEDEVYDDENFKNTLVDAASSMATGDPFEFKNKIGTLADKPSDKVKKALSELKDYESWALKPEFINNNEFIMKPCIKYGTKKGDFTHMSELFTPVLTVMRANDLKDAIDIANSTGYGLTGALESLDEKEWEYYKENIEVGNIYINKPTTGAIVLRQPFGGVKKSAVGYGRKVGIYNYITQFLDISQDEVDVNLKENEFTTALASLNIDKDTLNAAKSYVYHYENEFSKEKEYISVRGEDNLFAYKKIKSLLYIVDEKDSLKDILLVLIAAKVSGVKTAISYKDENEDIKFIKQYKDIFGIEFVKEADFKDYERIRYHGDCNEIYKKASALAKIIIRNKPLLNGRFELLYYYNEKSTSVSFHRYGNLGARALDFK
ncbi:bifunctional proline dehydrogenase/L-glutamate gamma-semialdehyde dehydrogenase [Campylobacter sputorum]|uniref:bifunctional proline dehydrogenase/L-glutamate gamma-semialdehyde dehydrogenase n=1 Tax=Campylobacter sputorum TaxID=206 RepID=UPI001E5C0E4F|nr:bifunctional proline dehydrogenase/L-glutamate gamma-semialdehyde dehydrogenase [Campylobacter sputorum]